MSGVKPSGSMGAATVSTPANNKVHFKCRNSNYPRHNVPRGNVPDDKVSWDIPMPDYHPIPLDLERVAPWADPDIRKAGVTPLKWNQVDGKVNRDSHMGTYNLTKDGLPLNPMGRTGVHGRGILGRWGPNHAADPIVTRWKRDAANNQVNVAGSPVLQFIAITREDNGQLAIPGGMVDPGEQVSATLKREFSEEALNSMTLNAEQRRQLERVIANLFSRGETVYKGYVDDPRNTDNAWMETVAANFHDETGDSVGRFPLCAGSDAKGVHWIDIAHDLNLYASHIDFIKEVAKRRKAHW